MKNKEDELEKIAQISASAENSVIIGRLEDALLASEDSFIELFNRNPLPQWIYDADSLRLLLVNDAVVLNLDYSKEAFLCMTILEMVPPEETKKMVLYNAFMKTTRAPFSVINFYRRKNSETVQAEATYVNITYKAKSCVLVSFVDTAERIKLEEKITLDEINRQHKITLSVINGQERERDEISQELHENICQLLATAKIYLGLARKDKPEENAYIEQAEKILNHTVNDIRTLSNSLVPSSMKLTGLEQSLRSLFETYLLSKNFTINLSFDPAMEDQDSSIKISLFRIIQEQLNNLLKQGGAQNIRITLDVSEYINLSIKDDGRGYDAGGNRAAGTGIVSIENRVALYNGTAKIISSAHHGHTLSVRMPNENHKKKQACTNILVVEDDLDDQEIITRAFAEVAPHCNITCLNDGKVLVDLLPSFSEKDLPSLIVLDYNMPLLNGLETLKILELDKRFNRIPKIIYSSSPQRYIKNLSWSSNAKAYITKGITMDEIKDNVKEMMSFVEVGNS